MKTKYKYICFLPIQAYLPKHSYKCYAEPADKAGAYPLLGTVRWRAPWKQYCFYPAPDTTFSASCLKDIQHFIGQL